MLALLKYPVNNPNTQTLFQEKDVFEKYYKQHLAKRLLHGRSSSEDAGATGCMPGWLTASRLLAGRPAGRSGASLPLTPFVLSFNRPCAASAAPPSRLAPCRAAAADQAEDRVRLPVHLQAGNHVWRHQAQPVGGGCRSDRLGGGWLVVEWHSCC